MPTPSSNNPAKRVNWEIAKLCLAEIQREAPILLQQAVVIGGVACWFYRSLLTDANDSDFTVPNFSEIQESHWLSKDLDFTNFFAEDARQLLKQHVVSDSQQRKFIEIAGVPIGFAQVGLTFDPDSAWTESWIANFEVGETLVECRMLDPISLYREKLSLSQRRRTESDQIHCALVSEFLRCHICKVAETLAAAKTVTERTLPVKFLISIRDRASEVCRDQRVAKRLNKILAGSKNIAPSERKLLSDLISPS
jgi:hypothetical protein